MLALKQEFVGTLHKSPYYLKMDEKKQDIERYSDKYQLDQQDSGEVFQPGKCTNLYSFLSFHVFNFSHKCLKSSFSLMPKFVLQLNY